MVFLILTCLTILLRVGECSHFRGGYITWAPVEDVPNQIIVTYRFSWSRGTYACTQETIDNAGVIGEGRIYYTATDYLDARTFCGDFDLIDNWASGTYSRLLTAPSTQFPLGYTSCCWASLVNGGATSWRLITYVDLSPRPDNGKINTSPTTAVKPIIKVTPFSTNTFVVPVADKDFDVVRCRWESYHVTRPASTTLTINEDTCELTFTAGAAGQVWAMALVAEDFIDSSSTTPLSEVAIQFQIYVVALAPGCTTNKPTLTTPSPESGTELLIEKDLLFKLEIRGIGVSSTHPIIDLETVSPQGLTKSSLMSGTGEEKYMTIRWTPTQLGPQVFCFAARDSCQPGNQRCVTLRVVKDAPSPGDVRLRVGNFDGTKGRLEYFANRTDIVPPYVNVCGDNFGEEEAEVVCRQLGLNETVKAVPLLNNPFGPGVNNITWIFGGCTGSEDTLDECGGQSSAVDQSSTGYYVCGLDEAVGVNCVQENDPPPELRLVGGTGKYGGRVELNAYGEWGTICGDAFGNNNAKVVCRQMGLPHGNVIVMDGGVFGPAEGPIVYDDVVCDGDEASINLCEHTEYGPPSDCVKTGGVAVICTNNEPVKTGQIQTYDHEFGFSVSSDYPTRWFRIQEGAIVKFICPTDDQVGLNANVNGKHIDMFWDFGGVELARKGEPHGERPDGTRVKEHFQMYQATGLGFNGRRGKRLLTMTYTARKEDNLKTLSCQLSDEDSLDSVTLSSDIDERRSMIRLLVLPGPPALRFQSIATDRVWPGGFVGEIHIPIDAFYNSWKMVLTFPKKVYRLYGGNFNIAREPCLHDGSCTRSKKTWVIYNTYENRVLSPLKDLRLSFVADVSKKINDGRGRALVADIKFYGYNKVFGSDANPIWEPWE